MREETMATCILSVLFVFAIAVDCTVVMVMSIVRSCDHFNFLLKTQHFVSLRLMAFRCKLRHERYCIIFQNDPGEHRESSKFAKPKFANMTSDRPLPLSCAVALAARE